jgi:hypothetical protein
MNGARSSSTPTLTANRIRQREGYPEGWVFVFKDRHGDEYWTSMDIDDKSDDKTFTLKPVVAV